MAAKVVEKKQDTRIQESRARGSYAEMTKKI